MRNRIYSLIFLAGSSLFTFNMALANETVNEGPKYDQHAVRVGSFTAFAEMVGLGVKKLALSSAMLPEEMNAFMADAERIAKRDGVGIYREQDLIVTDLFPHDVAKGKHVILIYTGTTLDEYLALKKEKATLVKSGKYKGEARKNIARKFGRLLSYPDTVIDEKIKKVTQ